MKKRFFNVTIGGYYVVSIILGIAMALTVCLMALDAWSYAFDRTCVLRRAAWEEYDGDYRNNTTRLSQAVDNAEARAVWEELDSQHDLLDVAWLYMPMQRLYDELYVMRPIGKSDFSYLPMLLMASAVVVVFLSVIIMEGKSANKAWRQKMHQAIGWGVLIILLDLAYWYARRRMFGSIPTGVVLVPVVLLIIPALVLKKTRIRKEKPQTETSQGEMPMPRPVGTTTK